MTDYTKLIERLRNTPNWQRESYGDWKQGTVHYDRAPFEAADAIEALQEENALLEGTLESRERNIAEMQAENERLKVESTNKNDWLVEQRKWEAHANALQAKLDATGKGEPVGYFEKNSFGIWWNVSPANQDIQGVVPLYAAPKALAPSREVIGRYMADKGFYLSKEALDGLMLKLEGIGGTP